MKINVVGTSGSGKTTFGRKLAEEFGIPFIEIDAIFWGPEWSFPEDQELFARLTNALESESWVLDGNYTRTLPVKWEQVDIVIWLDFSFIRTLYQAVGRAIPRLFSQEELWPGTGNRESLRILLSWDSIVLWTIKTHSRNKKKYTGYMTAKQFSHIKFIRLKSPAEANRFLNQISKNRIELVGESY